MDILNKEATVTDVLELVDKLYDAKIITSFKRSRDSSCHEWLHITYYGEELLYTLNSGCLGFVFRGLRDLIPCTLIRTEYDLSSLGLGENGELANGVKFTVIDCRYSFYTRERIITVEFESGLKEKVHFETFKGAKIYKGGWNV